MCRHDDARASDEQFIALTVRLIHMPDREAYSDLDGKRLWFRDCPACRSTLCRLVTK